jgi:hypothetical protein
MTDDGTLPDRLRNMVRNPNAIGTHSAACWQWHDDCALLLAADRVAERELADRLTAWSDVANVFEDTDDDRDDLRAAAVGLRRLAQLDTAIGQQVAELRAIHHPQWASPDGGYTTERRDGYTPVGCAECYPHDGSWPCVTAMVADDLAAVAEVAEDRGQTDG